MSDFSWKYFWHSRKLPFSLMKCRVYKISLLAFLCSRYYRLNRRIHLKDNQLLSLFREWKPRVKRASSKINAQCVLQSNESNFDISLKSKPNSAVCERLKLTELTLFTWHHRLLMQSENSSMFQGSAQWSPPCLSTTQICPTININQ